MKTNNVVLPYHTNTIKQEDIYYEQMMWCIYTMICCICLCTILILLLLVLIEKDVINDNSFSK